MSLVEDLLKPISAEEPCGPDLAYDPAFQQLETLVRGKPETQFSAAEDPDWKELRELGIEFHGKSKHLTAGVILALSLLKMDGFSGLRDGLALVRGLLENFWDTVYPRLDPEDNNDPTERMNILANLVSFGDPYRFIPRLQDTVIAQSPSLGRVKLADIILAKNPPSAPPEGQPAPITEAQIQAVFKDSNPDVLKAVYEAVGQSIESVRAIDAFLTGKVGTRGVNFEELTKSLKQVQAALAPYVAGAPVDAVAAADGQAGTAAAGGTAAGAARAVAVPGAINSREDVVQTLERICEFYRQNEPSSPVPLILYRAQRMAKMNFMEIVNELTPDAVTTVKVVTGPQPGETTTG
jgi:type VI secretion system protein ImpA